MSRIYAILADVYHGFPQSLQASTRLLLQLRLPKSVSLSQISNLLVTDNPNIKSFCCLAASLSRKVRNSYRVTFTFYDFNHNYNLFTNFSKSLQ